MFLPFIPGEHDATAVVLSNIAQAIGFSAILLLPIATVWLIFGRVGRRTVRVIAAAAASAIITLAAALGALVTNSKYLAIGLLALGAYLSFRFVRNIAKTEKQGFDATPLYLILIPLLVLLARFAFITTTVEFSRNHAIENSRMLIQDIEAFHSRNGRYPESLLSELEDYDPGVIGIPRYYYEPNGSAYNIYFEQYSNEFGVREFVMYNKLGQHRMHAHNIDRLQLSPADQVRQQGWHRVVVLPQENWKYFHFD